MGDLEALVEHVRRLSERGADSPEREPRAEDVASLVEDLATHQEELKAQNDHLQLAYVELGQANDELRRANQQLGDARARYADLYDFAPVGYVTLDETGTVLEANVKLAEMLAIGRSELVGRRLAAFVTESDRDDLHRFLRAFLAGKQSQRNRDLRLKRSAGGDLWVRSTWAGVEAKRGPRTIRVALDDISDHKSLQAQLAQADRMASVGLVAAGVAHEVNNPLTYVLCNLETFAEDLPRLPAQLAAGNADELHDMLSRVRSTVEGAYRIRDIVKHLRVFSHMDDQRVEPTNLAEVIDTAIGMAFNELHYAH